MCIFTPLSFLLNWLDLFRYQGLRKYRGVISKGRCLCSGNHILSENLERIFPGNLVCIFPAGNLTQEEAPQEVRTHGTTIIPGCTHGTTSCRDVHKGELLSYRDLHTGPLSYHLCAQGLLILKRVSGALQCSAQHCSLIFVGNRASNTDQFFLVHWWSDFHIFS